MKEMKIMGKKHMIMTGFRIISQNGTPATQGVEAGILTGFTHNYNREILKSYPVYKEMSLGSPVRK